MSDRAAKLFDQSLAKDKVASELFFTKASLGLNLCRMDGTWVESNPAFLEMIGYSAEEASNGLTYWKLTPEKYNEMEKVQLENLVKDGRYGPYEKEFIRKDGTRVPVRLNGFIIERTGEKLIWSIIEDLSRMQSLKLDLREKNKELETQKMLLDSIVENMPSAVFLKDVKNNFKVTFWNKSAERIFEIPREDILQKTAHDLWPKEQADIYLAADEKVAREGQLVDVPSEPSQSKTRGTIFLHTQKLPLKLPGDEKSRYLLCISDDVTEKLKAKNELELEKEKALRSAKLASLGEMSAGIAHEINNPLAIIEGSVHLLQKFINKPEKLDAKIKSIQKACGRISQIVNGLKKFSHGGDKGFRQARALEDIVRESLVLTASKSRRDGVPVSLESGTHAFINCNEIEIEQVLVNLINNSIDAVGGLSEKWVKVSVSEDHNTVILRVTDSGFGLSGDVQEKIYEPFFTTKEVGHGTGLGLSISKGILDEHNATIRLAQEETNTCFEVRFPKVEVNQRVA